MKIALLVESLDPSRGGAESYMHWLAGRLARDGHEVHVFATSFPPQSPGGVIEHRLPVGGFTALGRLLSLGRVCAAALAAGEFDVVHTTARVPIGDVYQPHGGTLSGSMEANLAALEGSFRRWFQRLRWRFSPRRRALLRLEEEIFAREGVEFVAVSEMVRRHIHRFHHVPPERISVVYNGVDTERFSPAERARLRSTARRGLGLAGGEVGVLLVAHNFRLKGLVPLIRAFAAARRRGGAAPGRAPDRLLVAGRGRPHPFLRLARKLQLADRVVFTGPVDNPLPLYAAADIYCQPTFYDPCSLTVLEAMACGLPVITTRNNGVSELIETGREGLVVDQPGNVEGLAEALLSLCEPTRRHVMGTAARARAEDLSTERNYRGILAVYQRVLARRRS